MLQTIQYIECTKVIYKILQNSCQSDKTSTGWHSYYITYRSVRPNLGEGKEYLMFSSLSRVPING